MESWSPRVFKRPLDVALRDIFSGGFGGAGLMVGLDDLKSFS